MLQQTSTLQSIYLQFREELQTIYSSSEVDVLVDIILENILDYTKIQVKMNLREMLDSKLKIKLNRILKSLKEGKPIQYILESAPFWGLEFHVDDHVLIPRPETEELVDLALKNIPKHSNIIDIGTGSGCIAIALKKSNNTLNVFGCDVDNNAIVIAKKNALNNKFDVSFFELDILSDAAASILKEIKIDCIVSNPPYIEQSEISEMHNSVTDFEPHLALFVKDTDPLIFYRIIANIAHAIFNKGGQLFFEINQKYGKEVLQLLLEIGFTDVSLLKDINDNERMIHAIL